MRVQMEPVAEFAVKSYSFPARSKFKCSFPFPCEAANFDPRSLQAPNLSQSVCLEQFVHLCCGINIALNDFQGSPGVPGSPGAAGSPGSQGHIGPPVSRILTGCISGNGKMHSSTETR